MRIDLLCVGRPKNRAFAALHDEYAARLARLGVPYNARFAPDVRPDGGFTEAHAKEREARGLETLGIEGFAVALDPSGTLMTTEELAPRLERWATPRATFFIGGPLGLHPALLERASWVWSLSPLTFPHELVRVLFAEQIYRAVTILRRVPYHK